MTGPSFNQSDFWTAWDLGIILQFAIAGFGVLLMLRDEGLPAWAALVGAVSFAFYSQHVLWIYHRWVLGASCWFPWIVWAIRRARRKNRLVDFWSVVFTTLAFRGGSLQSCLFVTLLVLCLFLADVWTIRKTDDRRSCLRLVASYATLAVGSTLLVSDVLLDTIPPFLDGCRELSHRGILANLKALPFLASAVFPAAFGTPQTMDAGKVFGTGLFDHAPHPSVDSGSRPLRLRRTLRLVADMDHLLPTSSRLFRPLRRTRVDRLLQA